MKKYKWTNRPWGRYKTLSETSKHKWKILEIFPDKRFSLQYHNYRNEYWEILKGYGKIRVGILNFWITENSKEVIYIDKKEIHRIENIGKSVLRILELQTGKCSEKDVVRIEDDFGRVKK